MAVREPIDDFHAARAALDEWKREEHRRLHSFFSGRHLGNKEEAAAFDAVNASYRLQLAGMASYYEVEL